ncbi:MAG TPA: hypothetical protein DF383_09980, partial [Deltaproteobacteria bacterium]|nr:hypothetical protein [Deltaproteobacteria bacterium]
MEKFQNEKTTDWQLIVQPADSSIQIQVNEISRKLGATQSCAYPFPEIADKPVIYLYPPRPMNVLVQLDLHGDFVFTHPAYDE